MESVIVSQTKQTLGRFPENFPHNRETKEQIAKNNFLVGDHCHGSVTTQGRIAWKACTNDDLILK